jgi:multicomponent Na+:H+ antiporter subunit F
MMMTVAMVCLAVLLLCVLFCLYRLAVGPHTVDRLLAFDLTGVLIAASLAVFALIQESWVYLEISMGLAVLAFVGTLAITHYVERGRIF